MCLLSVVTCLIFKPTIILVLTCFDLNYVKSHTVKICNDQILGKLTPGSFLSDVKLLTAFCNRYRCHLLNFT